VLLNNENMMKSRRMKWAVHVALMGEKRNEYRILLGKPEGKMPHVCGWAILGWILENRMGFCGSY
jgi:hypothetical protein